MTTFTLSHAQIAAIASVGAATPVSTSDRQITPILAAVQITVTPERVTAVATDRYIVTELSFPLGDTAHTLEPDSAHVIMLDSKDLASIVKNATVSRSTRADRAFFTFTTSDDAENGNVTVAHDYGQLIGEYRQIVGNYPPVARLFPEDVEPLTDMPHVNPAYFTRATKAHTPGETSTKERGGIMWQIAAAGTTHATKSGPILLTARVGADYRLRSLMQPSR